MPPRQGVHSVGSTSHRRRLAWWNLRLPPVAMVSNHAITPPSPQTRDDQSQSKQHHDDPGKIIEGGTECRFIEHPLHSALLPAPPVLLIGVKHRREANKSGQRYGERHFVKASLNPTICNSISAIRSARAT